jgi:hypothetical protein
MPIAWQHTGNCAPKMPPNNKVKITATGKYYSTDFSFLLPKPKSFIPSSPESCSSRRITSSSHAFARLAGSYQRFNKEQRYRLLDFGPINGRPFLGRVIHRERQRFSKAQRHSIALFDCPGSSLRSDFERPNVALSACQSDCPLLGVDRFRGGRSTPYILTRAVSSPALKLLNEMLQCVAQRRVGDFDEAF